MVKKIVLHSNFDKSVKKQKSYGWTTVSIGLCLLTNPLKIQSKYINMWFEGICDVFDAALHTREAHYWILKFIDCIDVSKFSNAKYLLTVCIANMNRRRRRRDARYEKQWDFK